jgi:hypothetical protein
MVEPMSEPASALVVLRSPVESPTAAQAGKLLADTAGPAAVRNYFSSLGFEVGPIVGVSFSIEGDRSLFESTFGSDTAELDLTRLPSSISSWLSEITRTEPPTFGPDRP